MPEAKKAKRTYEALSDSALNGLRLVQERDHSIENSETFAAPKGRSGRKTQDESEIVAKLIEFIRKI